MRYSPEHDLKLLCNFFSSVYDAISKQNKGGVIMLWRYLKFIAAVLALTFLFGVAFSQFGLTGGVIYGIVMSVLMLVDMVLIVALIPLVLIFVVLDSIGKKK